MSNPPNIEEPQVYEDFFKNVKSQSVKELKILYPVTHEMLRHFWVCLPAKTPEAEEKVRVLFLIINFFKILVGKNV